MKHRTLLAMNLLVLAIGLPTPVSAQHPTSADAYINETLATNFGAATTLQVSQPSLETFIRFDLSSLPTGTTGTSVGKATLVLYVSAVTAAGSFDVLEVGGTWNELTINNTNEPPLGTLIISAVPITTANKNNFVVIDVTQAVKDWLNGTVINNGVALQPNGSPVNVTFNSKESTTTSHNPQLNISLTEPPGDITQITAGAGLTGGGTTGNVPVAVDSTQVPFLSFPNTFTANQTVNGTLTASSFSGNGSLLTNLNPAYIGAGTASISITGNSATSATATNALNLGGQPPSAYQPAGSYASLGANNFNGSQSVTGNVSATGSLSAGTASLAGGLTGTTANFNGALSAAGAALPATGASTAASGFNSYPLDLTASVFNGANPIAQDFRWVTEPINNNTATASGTLNLQFGANGVTPVETGLSVASNGIISFANNQTFPGVGRGTITSVTAGTDLTGGGESGNVTLNLNTAATDARYAQLSSTNFFTGNQSVTGNQATVVVGDHGCGAGTAGVEFGNLGNCADNAIYQQGLFNLIINRRSGGNISFKEANGPDQMTLNSGGAGVGINATAWGGSGLTVEASGNSSIAISGAATDTVNYNVGIRGTSNGPGGFGILGISNATNSSGVRADAYGAGGAAGIFVSHGGGKILSGWNQTGEQFSLDGSGNVSANGQVSANNLVASVAVTGSIFFGSGTGLSGVALLGGANTFGGNQTIAGNGENVTIGNLGCSPNSAGISFQAVNCSSYALLDFDGNTIINRPTGGSLSFRENNGPDQMTIAPGGDVSINKGINNNGGGLKHLRSQTVVVPANAAYNLDVFWPTPFPDSAYTVIATPQFTGSGNVGCISIEIYGSDNTSVQLHLTNKCNANQSYFVNLIAIHD